MPHQLHPIEHRAREQAHGVSVPLTQADAEALVNSGRYQRSVGLDLAASHWRAPGGLHLTHSRGGDGLATGTDGAAIAATDPATGSDAGSMGTGAGGDGGWSLHVDRHDPHAGPTSALAHVATETGAVGPMLLLLVLLGPVGFYLYKRRSKR